MARPKIVDIKTPYRMTARGYPEPAVDDEALESTITMLFLTTPGERPRRRNFGMEIDRLVGANRTRATLSIAREIVRQAITAFVPQVRVLDVVANTKGDSGVTLDVIWEPRQPDGRTRTVTLATGSNA